MKLSELNPRWIGPNVFVFNCPHCPGSGQLLSCKNVVMSFRDQCELFVNEFGDANGLNIVSCRADMAWTFSGSDFASLSVTPSIDASSSGHWHGYLTNGDVA